MSKIILSNNIVFYKTEEILKKLDTCIKTSEPFALVRMGDGGLKLIHAFLNNDYEQINHISKQEGIPVSLIQKVLKLWKSSANICDYIDSPAIYFSTKFWNRTKGFNKKSMSDKTILRLKLWKMLYSEIGINNINYCNPEVNFLSCIVGKYGKISLPDLLKDKKICCVTSRSDVNEKIPEYNIDVLKIAGKNEDQYENSFFKVIDKIENDSTKYDIWLIAAGELGRIYPGLIKFMGGRAFDIGSLIDCWCGEEIPSRLKPYFQKTNHHYLKFSLTTDGRKFIKYI